MGIKAKNVLDGDEALELSISNRDPGLPQNEANAESATAAIKNFNDCGIDGLVEKITAAGACIDDGNANKAVFAYQVRLSGSYNQDQTYYYAFKGNKNLEDYEVTGIYVNGVLARAQGASGSFEIGEDQLLVGNEFTVEVGIKAKNVLDGDEALELSISNRDPGLPQNEANAESATAAIKNFNDCGIDGLVEKITAAGACIDDGNANKAVFAYQVRLSGSYNQDQTYYYAFKGIRT